MKCFILGLVLICMAGCSFRDGASTTAASLTSGMWSMIGVNDTYGDSKDYWDKKLGVQPEIRGYTNPETEDVSDQTR